MSLIQIQHLSFTYPSALTPVFSDVTLDLDTSWRMGLVGRNGRGKTTFLRLLLGELQGTGTIDAPEPFEYFPAPVADEGRTALAVARDVIAPFDAWERDMQRLAALATDDAMRDYGEVEEAYAAADGYVIDEAIAAECGRLGMPPDALLRPYETLSGGERVKLVLAAMFLKKHRFLLIDEPTDHLDADGRERVAKWLATKSGFIVVSHDRAFLDRAVDHVLAINRTSIELQRGNYTSWRENRDRQDDFERAENRKLEANIGRLQAAAARTENWSDNIERGKKGAGALEKAGTGKLDRGYIGHQAARMMQRSKAIERRRSKEMEQQQSLLKDIEETEALRFHVLKADQSRLVTAQNLSLAFGGRALFEGVSFTLAAGERLAVAGKNGSGKSSLLKILAGELAPTGGEVRRAGGLVISTVPQDTAFLRGSLQDLAAARGVDKNLFLALLRKLDFEREAFAQDMARYSAGQKKKVCLALSLATPAHLFIWDEPLNYIDVQSREQLEAAVLLSEPAMLLVEHDAAFLQRVATKTLEL